MSKEAKEARVPAGRLSRFASMTRIAAGVAGGMMAEGARQFRNGNRPRIQDLFLTPQNAKLISTELAKLRGAAMKLGQMLSMDTGDLIPKELAEILSRLRSDAHTMPRAQLNRALVKAYGKTWRDQFTSFEYEPVAAASIGQVNRETTAAGNDIVLKIQYPGVRRSINSDIDNVATLLRMSGLIPKKMDLAPLLAEAKVQLHDEGNYLTEAEYLRAFGKALSKDKRFLVPRLHQHLTTDSILAMDYADGDPIESIAELPQAERDRVVGAMIELMLHELFTLNMVQTDANFANYLYQPATGRIVLLDFGATRRFAPEFVTAYRKLLKAMLADDQSAMVIAAETIGYVVNDVHPTYRALLIDVFQLVGEVFRADAPYTIKGARLSAQMTEKTLAMKDYRDDWHAPPIDAIFFHRKLGGMFLLASRVDARVFMRPLLEAVL